MTSAALKARAIRPVGHARDRDVQVARALSIACPNWHCAAPPGTSCCCYERFEATNGIEVGQTFLARSGATKIITEFQRRNGTGKAFCYSPCTNRRTRICQAHLSSLDMYVLIADAGCAA